MINASHRYCCTTCTVPPVITAGLPGAAGWRGNHRTIDFSLPPASIHKAHNPVAHTRKHLAQSWAPCADIRRQRCHCVAPPGQRSGRSFGRLWQSFGAARQPCRRLHQHGAGHVLPFVLRQTIIANAVQAVIIRQAAVYWSGQRNQASPAPTPAGHYLCGIFPPPGHYAAPYWRQIWSAQ